MALTPGLHRRAVRDGVLVGLAGGIFLGADWGAAVAAMIDSRGDRLDRPGEVVVSVVLALVGGAGGYWFARARKH